MYRSKWEDNSVCLALNPSFIDIKMCCSDTYPPLLHSYHHTQLPPHQLGMGWWSLHSSKWAQVSLQWASRLQKMEQRCCLE